MITKSKEIYEQAFNSGLKPDPDLSVSQWADKYRVLSQTASSEAGRWRTSRTPYSKEIMDCLSTSSKIQKIVVMKGAQLGLTEAGNNWTGYVIAQAPSPMLVVQPTVELGKRWSKGRLAPLIEDTKILSTKVKDARSRDSGNTLQSKEFAGGIIVITGANSAVGLRSMPVRYLFLDEVDAYPLDASGEGDPVNLAIQRTSTFSRRKIFMVSTPTVQGRSRIEKEFDLSDKRYYHVPCPECKELQVLKWSNMEWEENNPDTAKYKCEHCGYLIENHQKTWMLNNGKWIATAKSGNSKVAGFHLSSLYSPVGWFSWSDITREFLDAKKDTNLLKTWINTKLGETWQDRGEAPEWENLYERREDYKIGSVPKDVLLLTAGADVQQDRIEVEVVGWAEDKQSWSIGYYNLFGDTASNDPWDKLENLLATKFKHDNGALMDISLLAIDSGYATQTVYNWVRNQPNNKVIAIKGNDLKNTVIGTPKKVDVTTKGKLFKRGVKLWPVSVSVLKSELYQWLFLKRLGENDYPKGYCHFPYYDAEYFKQITAEQLVTKLVKGYYKPEWQKTRERNEALDCRIYARAASIVLGVDHWSKKKWDILRENIKETIEAKPVRKRIVKKSSFIK